jgi:hypothetical protein
MDTVVSGRQSPAKRDLRIFLWMVLLARFASDDYTKRWVEHGTRR